MAAVAVPGGTFSVTVAVAVAGRIADAKATVADVGQEIFDFLLRVASGERTCSERLGHKEFVPWRIGPVM